MLFRAGVAADPLLPGPAEKDHRDPAAEQDQPEVDQPVGSTGVTPGGFGLVEVTLTAALVAAGLTTARALTAVLAYRLINFWLILFGGGIAMIFLSRAREQRIRRYSRPEQHPGASDGRAAGRGTEERTSQPRVP